jgi:hypothetical protein
MDWFPHLESSQVLAMELTVEEAEGEARVPPFAAAVLGPGQTGHRPAEWFHAPALRVQQVVAAPVVVLVAQAAELPGGVRQGAGVIAFCLPARPESRRCYQSPQFIP